MASSKPEGNGKPNAASNDENARAIEDSIRANLANAKSLKLDTQGAISATSNSSPRTLNSAASKDRAGASMIQSPNRAAPPPQLKIITITKKPKTQPSSAETGQTPVMRSMFPKVDPTQSVPNQSRPGAPREEDEKKPQPDQTSSQQSQPGIDFPIPPPPPGGPPPKQKKSKGKTPAALALDRAPSSVYSQASGTMRWSNTSTQPTASIIPPPPHGLPKQTLSGLQKGPISRQTSTASVPYASKIQSPLRAVFNTSTVAESPKVPPPERSTAEELLDLWSIASGQSSYEAKELYVLGLQCDSTALNNEVIHLSASNSLAVWSAHAGADNLRVTRTHPLDPASTTPSCNFKMHTPEPSAPIIASIFPRAADECARETSARIAKQCGLAGRDYAELENEAIARMRSSETAQLIWQSDSMQNSGFFLVMPRVGSDPESAEEHGLSVKVDPGNEITIYSAFSGEVDEIPHILLSLDLKNNTMVINTQPVIQLSPSPYTLDILLAAMLALVVHVFRQTTTTALPAPSTTPPLTATQWAQQQQQMVVPYFEPPPGSRSSSPAPSRAKGKGRERKSSSTTLLFSSPLASPTSRASGAASPTPSAAGGMIIPAPQQAIVRFRSGVSVIPGSGGVAGAGAQHYGHVPGTPYAFPNYPPLDPRRSSSADSLALAKEQADEAGVAPELRRSTTGVDLSRFQAYDLRDERLGPGTRGVLRVLYWAFGVAVFVLGVVVGVVAEGVVALGGLIGAPKKKEADGTVVRGERTKRKDRVETLWNRYGDGDDDLEKQVAEVGGKKKKTKWFWSKGKHQDDDDVGSIMEITDVKHKAYTG